MTRWRVLLVSELLPDPQPGGLARHVLDLADELHRRGHAVDLMGQAGQAVPLQQQGPGRFVAAVRGHQRRWKEGTLGCFHPLRAPLVVRGLRDAIVAQAPSYDVVHYHGHLPWVGALLPAGLPFTQTRHDYSGDCPLKTRFRAGRDDPAARCDSSDAADCAGCATGRPNVLQRVLSAAAVRDLRQRTAEALAARPVVFVSQHVRQRFERSGIASPQGQVIHNALARAPLQAAAQGVLPAGDGGVDVFAAAVLWPYKGFASLLDTLQRQPAPPPGWRLTVAGDGPQRAELQARHQALPVQWLGWQAPPQVLQRLARADALVVPSTWDEPCASIVLEGLALGRVVYALRRGGTPELAAAAGPGAGRLRLFDDMDTLVSALRQHDTGAEPPLQALQHFDGDMAHMADAVLAHYARHFQPRNAR
jgi:glycogen(starch) synthase